MISDFKWCIENDWQVYLKVVNNVHCRIAIRKGGISSQGKHFHYCKEQDLKFFSKETLGNVIYKNQNKAFEELPKVYKYLRDTYGKI